MTPKRALCRTTWLIAVVGFAVVAALIAGAGFAAGSPVPYCATYTGGGIPPGSGIPPWGFHASQSFGGGTSGYTHGWGNVDLDASRISGKICQDVHGRGGTTQSIAVTLGPRIMYHSHVAEKWGFPGNIVIAPVEVSASTDSRCKVGTRGHVTMYASYNGVRSDSVEFFLGAACRDQSRLYHGPQVDAQVPPL